MHTPSQVVTIRGTGARTPLFLVHSIAGELSWLPPLARLLPDEQPLFGFATAGLNSDEPFPPSLEALAARYAHDLQRIQPHGPYLLGGYSFGGVVAFAIAQHLQRAGETVYSLILIDAFEPTHDLVQTLSEWAYNGLLLQVVCNLLALGQGATTLLKAGLLPAGDGDAQAALATEFLLTNTSMRHTPAVLRQYLVRCQSVMLHHAALLRGYTPHPLRSPVRTSLLQNTLGLIGNNSKLSLPELPDWQRDPPHGWTGLIPNPIQRFAIPAEHFLFGIAPAIDLVAAVLNRILPTETLHSVPHTRPARPAPAPI